MSTLFKMKKIGIIGIGNPLRQDDGIGILLLQKLIERKDELPLYVEYVDGGTGGMNLLHQLVRFDIVLIIDAANINKEPGETQLLSIDDIISQKIPITISTHESDIMKIIQVSKTLDESPEKLFIFGIQPKNTSFGDDLSFELKQKMQTISDKLFNEIQLIIKNNK